MSSPMVSLIRELAHVRELTAYNRILYELDGRGLPADELTRCVEAFAEVLARRPQGLCARAAVVAGAFVEWGGSPVPLAAVAPRWALQTMRDRVRFSELWPRVRRLRAEPKPERKQSMRHIVGLFGRKAGALGLTDDEATNIAFSFFDAAHWVNLMITLMMRREFRDAAGALGEVGTLGDALADRVERAHWLSGLARVLDDEPVVAIDNATGRGFRLTMSGIGDNYQLHTLLADRVTGDASRGLLAGPPPAASWVAAATTAPPLLPVDDPVWRRYRLFDATGAHIHPEGVPADIAVLDGARVIVLHPPLGRAGWTNGRIYESMVPTLTLDHVMSADESAHWRSLIAPARETDSFGRNPRSS
jgi:hypothetical protein